MSALPACFIYRRTLNSMIMRKFVLTAVVAVLAVITAGAQTAGNKKPSKQERKAMQARIDSLMNLKAQSAINDTAFVIEADEVTFKRGYTVHVTSNTNFIAFCGDKAVVQVAFNVPWPGFNGLGGITLEGSVSGYKKDYRQEGQHIHTGQRQRRGNISPSVHHPVERRQPGHGQHTAELPFGPHHARRRHRSAGRKQYFPGHSHLTGVPLRRLI